MHSQLPQSLQKPQVVLVGQGIEPRNLGNGHQINFFTVLDADTNEWLTYQLPALKDGKASCPVVGTAHLHPDGTIYIAAAGGVLNRLTPDGRKGYRHSYVILGDKNNPAPEFSENPAAVTLIAKGDKPVEGSEPQVMRTVDGVEVGRGLFQSFRRQKDDPAFNLLIEQELIDTKKLEALARKPRVVGSEQMSLNQCVEQLADATVSAERKTMIQSALLRKDGPMKDQVIRLWERNNEHFPKESPEQLVHAGNSLYPGLGEQWKNLVLIFDSGKQNWKRKVYDERLPFYRVNVAASPADENSMVVAVMGEVYRMEHGASPVHLGTLPQEGNREVDVRGLQVLSDNTIVVGDMGADDAAGNADAPIPLQVANPVTFRVVEFGENGQVVRNEAMTRALVDKLQPLWGTERPRVKSMFAGKVRVIAPGHTQGTLYIRTKHSHSELVAVDYERKGAEFTCTEARPLERSNTTNNEYLSFPYEGSDKPLMSWETEDYVRTLQTNLMTREVRPSLAATPVNIGAEVKGSTFPDLPSCIPYAGHGYNGIFVRIH